MRQFADWTETRDVCVPQNHKGFTILTRERKIPELQQRRQYRLRNFYLIGHFFLSRSIVFTGLRRFCSIRFNFVQIRLFVNFFNKNRLTAGETWFSWAETLSEWPLRHNSQSHATTYLNNPTYHSTAESSPCWHPLVVNFKNVLVSIIMQYSWKISETERNSQFFSKNESKH